MYNLHKLAIALPLLVSINILMSYYISDDNSILFVSIFIVLTFLNLILCCIFGMQVCDGIPFKVKKIENSNYFVHMKNNRIIILYNSVLLFVFIQNYMVIDEKTTHDDIIKFVNNYKNDNTSSILEEFKNYKF